ncbi:endopeptidase La [Hahella aquimaris]|uniref:endopeptidase La n=1 Tax=Hahella sp. HNIBRBA332 TaxID=3015983 RepID=UPI00273CAA78|nr:endopeptidase La [Hahella sp. HNIBRBA332]WLQ15294.1 endopeptidase La [Hahella sp. HNIBRBA332]
MVEGSSPIVIPLLPLRDVVVFPHMVIPLFVGRAKSIKALEEATEGNKEILLVAQRDPADEDPGQSEIYGIGTVSTILQMLKLPDGTVKVLVEGNYRAHIDRVENDDYLSAKVSELPEPILSERSADVLTRSLLSQFEQYVKLSKKIPNELSDSLSNIAEPGRLADTIAAHLELKLESKQELLEVVDVKARVEALMQRLENEIDILQVEQRIRGRVKKQMEKSQREYYLNEQMKAIQKEMGDLGDGGNELEQLEKRILSAGMPEEARKKAESELSKLKMMSPMSAEATVVRSYIDWMVNIPWKKRSRVKHDLDAARKILNEDHYGLEEVKERILEYLAVQSRVKKMKGPVLCLVGPPGVGKTSLGQSVAKATNRKYVRMALGGVRDEAEIRGHRRTYIGSLPGKLLQKLAKVNVKNPLFLFDEIDKMGMDHRGDPASALLEVLDPEQNHTFNDHYLEVDYDLSEVMFVCTSNTMNIPPALLDRMEIIRIPGYTEDEKVNIAQKYLLPKQMVNNGLQEGEMETDEQAIRTVIRYYTKEAGVRGLEREIAKICRKVVKENVLLKSKKGEPRRVTEENLEDYLGVRKFNYGKASSQDRVGQVTGLAWTQVGGELLTIECTSVPGKGKVVKTGSLGDVMQESIQAALTVVRGRSHVLGIAPDFHEKNDIHVHVPEGATPKDGPSAGIGMCTALVSSLTNAPVKANVAMTGEITLRGEVLAIGGLKEKLLAAHRGGIKTVVIPQENVRDLKEIPDNIKNELEIIPVTWIDEVWNIALGDDFANRLSSAEGGVSEKDKGSINKGDETSDGADRINTH